jgi:hypothetical protein
MSGNHHSPPVFPFPGLLNGSMAAGQARIPFFHFDTPGDLNLEFDPDQSAGRLKTYNSLKPT